MSLSQYSTTKTKIVESPVTHFGKVTTQTYNTCDPRSSVQYASCCIFLFPNSCSTLCTEAVVQLH